MIIYICSAIKPLYYNIYIFQFTVKAGQLLLFKLIYK